MAEFDELPGDAKLHIFSFLNTREMLNVIEINRTNAVLLNERNIWQMRLQRDFGIRAAEGEDALGKYKQIYPAMKEKELLIAFVRFVVNKENHHAGREFMKKAQADINRIKNSMYLEGVQSALAMANSLNQQYGNEPEFIDSLPVVQAVYDKLFFSSPADLQAYLQLLLMPNQRIAHEKREEMKIASHFIKACGTFAAVSSVRLLLQKMSDELGKRFLVMYGSNLISTAIQSASTDFVKLIMQAGLDPAATRNLQQGRIGFDATLMSLIPIAVINLLLMRKLQAGNAAQYPQHEKIARFQEIQQILLEYGADPLQMITGDQGYFFADGADNAVDYAGIGLRKLDQYQFADDDEKKQMKEFLQNFTKLTKLDNQQTETYKP